MTAPAAPVIDFRTAGPSKLRIRWAGVTGAATYKVYNGGVWTGQTITGTAGQRNEANVLCGEGDTITVTAINAGAEESVASNTITVKFQGGSTSYPAQGPRGPYYSNPLG